MRAATDTTMRYLAMLETIPVYPRRKSTRQILEAMREKDPNYDVNIRSIQRDLDQLSRLFPIASDQSGRANYWFWTDKNSLTQIPAMSETTAFALRLAEEHLKLVMPPSTLQALDPYFRHAEKILIDTDLGRWTEKTAILPQGLALNPPAIQAKVQESVYLSLMRNRQVEVLYRRKFGKRSQRIILNPLGIAVRSGIVYLIATSWKYEDIRHYVLHRMSEPRLLDEPTRTPNGFHLAEHIRNDQRFAYPQSTHSIELRALFDADAGAHLLESRIGDDQRTTQLSDGRMLIEATMSDTAELRWWLAAFGSAVEVLEPLSLRAEFREHARRLRNIYEQSDS